MVVYETFEWATFTFIRKIPFHDALIIAVVTAVTVATDLAVAVVVGVIMASLVFAWETARNIHAQEKNTEDGSKEYIIHGPLFFGSTTQFKTLFSPRTDADNVIIDFRYSRVADHSAIDAIKYVVDQYRLHNKTLHLRHLSQECRLLLGRAASLVDVNIHENPSMALPL